MIMARMSRSWASLIFFLFSAAGGVNAQHSNGYLFIAPGGLSVSGQTNSTVQLGAGGEVVLTRGIGLGIEGGALATTANFTSTIMAAVSPNGYYHFIHSRDAHVDPFVTVGYSAFMRKGIQNLFNYGVGVNYWFRPSLGMRLEFRDHIHYFGAGLDSPSGFWAHYWGVRIGVVF
jgi:hypothetical protein